MRIYAHILVLLSICVFFISCAADSASDAAGAPIDCPAPELIVKNDSEYQLNQVLMHNRIEYLVLGVIPPQIVIATNMQTNSELTVTALVDNDSKYFTFIRNITTGSSQEYAFTTSKPINFYECKKYTLHILEEDFLIYEVDNMSN